MLRVCFFFFSFYIYFSRCWELAQLEASEEQLFLWKAFSGCLVTNTRDLSFVPSEDLLSAVQEMGLVQTSLLRLALQKLVAARPYQVVAGAMRWQEKNMRVEVVRASLVGGSGAEVVCRLLEEKTLSSEAEEVIVSGLCSLDVQNHRKAKHMIRAAVALKSRLSLLLMVLQTLKSDLDQRRW